MKNFTVIQSNPNSKGGFVTKLSTTVATPFGAKVATYYVSGTKKLEPETKVELDMNDWTIATHTMENPSTGEQFEGKWLHVK